MESPNHAVGVGVGDGAPPAKKARETACPNRTNGAGDSGLDSISSLIAESYVRMAHADHVVHLCQGQDGRKRTPPSRGQGSGTPCGFRSLLPPPSPQQADNEVSVPPPPVPSPRLLVFGFLPTASLKTQYRPVARSLHCRLGGPDLVQELGSAGAGSSGRG